MSDVVILAGIAVIVPVMTTLMAWRKQSAELKALRAEVKGVRDNVNGHLSKITEALAKEATTNVKLTVENDRLNEGTTTVPVLQTPEMGDVARNPADGTLSVTERRKS